MSSGSTLPISSPAVRSSGWPSPGSSPCSPGASCWTSPPPCWTPSAAPEVLRTIKELNRERGVTVVLITHHMDEAAQADRLVVMTKGKVVADGAPKEVFSATWRSCSAVGLTVPETTQLLWELRQAGLDVPLDALSDEECAQALCQLLNAASKKGSQP